METDKFASIIFLVFGLLAIGMGLYMISTWAADFGVEVSPGFAIGFVALAFGAVLLRASYVYYPEEKQEEAFWKMRIKKLEFKEDKHGRTILSKEVKNKKGVYLLFDKNLTLVYVGKTIDFRTRFWAHISKNNTQRFGRETNSNSIVPLNLVKYYSFIAIESDKERNILEVVLINLCSPKLNIPSKVQKRDKPLEEENE